MWIQCGYSGKEEEAEEEEEEAEEEEEEEYCECIVGVQRGYDVPLLSSLPKGGGKMD